MRHCDIEGSINKRYKSRRIKIAIVLSVLVLIVLLIKPLYDRFGLGPRQPVQTATAHYNADRTQLLPPTQLIRLINPRTGSTVLDLGAGFGLFTIPLAHAVGDGGKIFATDMDMRALAFVEEYARKNNLRNVITVRVNSKGLDPFYTRQTFDIIFASEVVYHINDPDTFFYRLRESLREESGRLWVVDMRLDPDFTLWEFGDSKGLFDALRSLGAESPVTRSLRDEVRKALSAAPPAGAVEGLTAKAIEDLNRILDDLTLWPTAGKLRLNSREESLRQYLSMVVERSGSIKGWAGRSEGSQSMALRLLNRLVLQDLLGSHRWEKAFSLVEVFGDSQWKLLNSSEARLGSLLVVKNIYWMVEIITRREIIRESLLDLFVRAEYIPVQEHRGFPYHYIWEFKRERKTKFP
jgi:2-polyprenyl-3-methyl-5-hydroxy-6-metoxy-1,4-benzoquinol methylase